VRRHVLALVVLALGLLVALTACGGGPPAFHGGPGEVRASPVPVGHGEVSFPANITVDGTPLYVFTHGVRRADAGYQANISVVVNPKPGRPSDDAVQGWLGKGDSLQAGGLTVTVVAVYPGDGQSGYADVRVTAR
jgi:hypothetical protein